jgi:CubicO group peptidase (beta-lactamase class C family)
MGGRVEEFLSAAAAQGNFAGTAALVLGEKLLLSRAYGASDALGRVPFASTTASQIASVSKQFTAAAILLLEEQDKLTLQDRLPTWIEGSPRAWEGISVQHLLTHTSGLPHWRDLPDLDLFHPVRPEVILRAFASVPLRFRPGAGWSYSSPGYQLLGTIVERASGMPYPGFLQERIFRPLGMQRTFAGSSPPDGVESATGLDQGAPVPSFDLDTTGKGAGDVWSTAEDLLIWDRAMSQPGRLLSAASIERTFRAYAALPAAKAGDAPELDEPAYGYGWYLAKMNGHKVRFHSGDNPGFRALNLWIPTAALFLTLCSNRESTNVHELAVGLLKRCNFSPRART